MWSFEIILIAFIVFFNDSIILFIPIHFGVSEFFLPFNEDSKKFINVQLELLKYFIDFLFFIIFFNFYFIWIKVIIFIIKHPKKNDNAVRITNFLHPPVFKFFLKAHLFLPQQIHITNQTID